MADTSPDKKDKGRSARDEKGLDEGLEETFPASDPPASVQPGLDRPAPSSGYDEDAEHGR